MLNLELWRTRFAEHMALRGWSLRTIQSYCLILRQFFVFLDSAGVDTPSAITRDTLEGFREDIFERRVHDKPLALRTQSLLLCGVKAFTRFLLQRRVHPGRPGRRSGVAQDAPHPAPGGAVRGRRVQAH